MKLSLESERLRLRPFRTEDAEDMFNGWASDPEVTKYLTWPTHENIETTKALLAKWVKESEEKPERLNFAIERKEDGKLIGGIDVVGYLDGVHGTPVIGYNLSRAFWNRDYMTEALNCLLSYLFGQGYDAVRIDAAVANTGSNRVIQKSGGTLFETKEMERPLMQDTMTVNCYLVKKDALRLVFNEEGQHALAYKGPDQAGFCSFVREKGGWVIDHTVVRPEFGGQGIAACLVREVMRQAEKRGISLSATCWYAKKLV